MLAAWIGGFVAAEGSFTTTAGPNHRRFLFQIGLGAVDTSVCELLRDVLGVGRIVSFDRRKPHYDDEVTFVVTRLQNLIDIVVPFMDAHLPASHKRGQYEAWRSQLVDYWEHQARRRRPCRLDGARSRHAPTGCAGLTSGRRWAAETRYSPTASSTSHSTRGASFQRRSRS